MFFFSRAVYRYWAKFSVQKYYTTVATRGGILVKSKRNNSNTKEVFSFYIKQRLCVFCKVKTTGLTEKLKIEMLKRATSFRFWFRFGIASGRFSSQEFLILQWMIQSTTLYRTDKY